MNYESKPTAKGIFEFARRMERQWSNQDKLDKMMIELITLSNRELTLPTWNHQPGGASQARPSGIAYSIWRENAQLLKLDPSFKIPVPEDMDDMREHVDGTVEPLLAAIWKQTTKAEDWWDSCTDDYPAVGRAWAFTSHVPKRWATDEIKRLTRERNEAETEAEVKRLDQELYKLKQGKLPLRTRYVNPRGTWTYFGTENWCPQVVECRTMTVDAARDEYGDDFDGEYGLPSSYSGSAGTDEVKVYHYANWKWCATVLGDGEDTKFAEAPWEHGLGRNPYHLFEADTLPQNDQNLRWAGLLFHAVHDVFLLDQIITDLAWVHHEWTLSPVIVKHDPDAYEMEAKTDGRPPPAEYGPGKQLDIWNTESIERGPVPEIPQQSLYLIQTVQSIIEKTAMVPAAERGEIKAGTSNNAYTSQIMVAQRRSRGVLRGMSRFVEAWAANILRGIYELTKPSGEDDETNEKVSVFDRLHGKKGLISAGAKDVDGYEDAVLAEISQPIEVDEYTRWLVGQLKVDRFGFSPEAVVEEMGYSDPEAVTKRGRRFRMREATFEEDYKAMLALSGQMFAQLSPEQQQESQELFANASPEVQQMVGALSRPAATSSPNGQSAANEMGAHRQQLPQNPIGPVSQ